MSRCQHGALAVLVGEFGLVGGRRAPEQRLDQRAFRQRAVCTLPDHVLEHPLHSFPIGDLRPHIVEVCGGDGARLGAGLVALVDDTQQLTDFVKGEAKLTRP